MTATLSDGVYFDISREQYDRIERVNFSTLKHIAPPRGSPAHYRHALTKKFKDTDAMKCGRAIHIMVFEPERVHSSVAIWDGERRAGNDWKRFVSANAGRELLTEAENERCQATAAAVRTNQMAAKFLSGGRAEVTLLWTAKIGAGPNPIKIRCKGRLDFIVDSAALVDLKSTMDASPGGFGRQASNLRMSTQAVWYQDAYEQLTNLRLPYYLVAAENFAPFVTQVYRVPDLALAQGREEYTEWLERLALCRETATWPAYAEDVLELELPSWAFPNSDEDLSGLGLEFHAPQEG